MQTVGCPRQAHHLMSKWLHAIWWQLELPELSESQAGTKHKPCWVGGPEIIYRAIVALRWRELGGDKGGTQGEQGRTMSGGLGCTRGRILGFAGGNS